MENIQKILEKSSIPRYHPLPTQVTDSEILRRIDTAIENRNPYVLSCIYRKLAHDEDTKLVEDIINASISTHRELHADDKELIKNLKKAFDETSKKVFIFHSIGNQLFLAEVMDELDSNEDLPECIRVLCLLWTYQNIVEIIYAHLSEIFYVIALKKNDDGYLKEYTKREANAEHLMRGELLNFAKKKGWDLTTEDSKTFLHENKLRNKLSHANCFYDTKNNELIISNSEKLKKEEFIKEFERVRDFLYELIHTFLGEEKIKLKEGCMQIAKELHKRSRADSKFFGKNTNPEPSKIPPYH